MLILLPYAGGSSPDVLSVDVRKNEMRVVFAASNTGIINIVVTAENNPLNIKKTVIVGWDMRVASITDVDHTIAYNVTVLVYDICRRSYKSGIYPVNGLSLPSSSETNKGMQSLEVLLNKIRCKLFRCWYEHHWDAAGL